AQKLRFETDLVVQQRVGRKAQGLVELRRMGVVRSRVAGREGATRGSGIRSDVVSQRLSIRSDPDRSPSAGHAVERARTIALRVGVVEHRVRGHVPAEVRAALEPRKRRMVIVVVDRRRDAAAVRLLDAAGTRAVLRTDFLLYVAVPARAAGQRQHLRYEIVIDRGEARGLLVAGL